jgi:hypothetical protein
LGKQFIFDAEKEMPVQEEQFIDTTNLLLQMERKVALRDIPLAKTAEVNLHANGNERL